MATVLTEGVRPGHFLLSEAAGQRSRENIVVTIAGSVALVDGTVLGKITATGKYVKYASGASNGSEAPAGVLYGNLPGVNGDYKAVGFVRDCEVIKAALDVSTSGVVTALAALGVLARV